MSLMNWSLKNDIKGVRDMNKFKFFFMVFFSVLLCTSANAFRFHKVKRVPDRVGSAPRFNYDVKKTFDFNGDGVNDHVVCNKNNWLLIKNGQNLRGRPIFRWNGPRTKFRRIDRIVTWKINHSGCDIVKMPNGKPAVVISNFWDTFRHGNPSWRANKNQYVVFHNGSGYTVQPIFLESGDKYNATVRSVKCHKYPGKLVRKGYKRGALCFFSDYAATDNTRTALLKLELTNRGKDIVAKDLSSSIQGAPWSQGAQGTRLSTMRSGNGFNHQQKDGAFMMDSAFLDFNRDGFIDFVTVGQHASVRVHKMKYDSRAEEGLSFTTENLTRADRDNEPTEFIRVSYMGRLLKGGAKRNAPCVYMSMEPHSGRNNKDYINCYFDNRWTRFDLPNKINSSGIGASVVFHRRLGLIVKTKHITRDRRQIPLTFRVPRGRVVLPEPPEPVRPPIRPIIDRR